jgi:hypothetical protein
MKLVLLNPLEITLLIASVLGLVPFSFNAALYNKYNRCTLMFKKITYLTFAATICLLNFSSSSCNVNYKYLSTAISNILNCLYCTSICLVSYIVPFIYENQYKMIVVKMNQFDYTMNKYGGINNDINPMEILIYTLNLIFLVTTIFFYVKHYIHEEINHFFCLIFYNLGIIISIVVKLLIIVLLLELYKRFKLLNSFLKSLIGLTPYPKGKHFDNHDTDISKKIEELSNLHYSLCTVGRQINHTFAPHIAVKFSGSFCLVVVFLFYLTADDQTFNDRFPTSSQFYLTSFWIFFIFYEAFALILGFRLVTVEVNKANYF